MPRLNHGRRRNLNPEFYTDEKLLQCSLPARFLFPWLWCVADRVGRLEEPHPTTIIARCFPCLPITIAEVAKALDELVAVGVVVRYQAGGKRVLCIPRFLIHQRPHTNEVHTVLPPPPGYVEPSNEVEKQDVN